MIFFTRNPKLSAAILIVASFTLSCATQAPPRPEVDIDPAPLTYQDGSLWPGVSRKNLLFSDNKANEVGDIVTVYVLEKTTALNKANTTDERSTSGAFEFNSAAGDSATVPTAFTAGGGLKNKGTGVTGRSDSFSATVSCLVTEVLPNGNLIVEGQRRMTINNEEQFIIVRGMVRKDDITYNNTITSGQMANADIIYTGAGGIDGGTGPGWLGEALQLIWPF